jgi:hypothetical protein
MCLQVGRPPVKWSNDANIRSLAAYGVNYIKRVGFRLNTLNHIFPRPSPTNTTNVGNMLMRAEDIGLSDAGHLYIRHDFSENLTFRIPDSDSTIARLRGLL